MPRRLISTFVSFTAHVLDFQRLKKNICRFLGISGNGLFDDF